MYFMKKIFVLIVISFFTVNMNAQEKKTEKEEETAEETPRSGFKKENLFTGGGIQLSLSSSTFIIGASPVLGYSINKWLDAGILLNFTYYSNRHVTYYSRGTGLYYISDDKLKQTVLGPGIFAKFYPLKFLFIQAQGELNFISERFIYANGQPTDKTNYTVPSLLVGAGYCSGRQGIGDLYYYVSLLFDVAQNSNSPYVEQILNGKVNVLPILRAGLQIPLFQGKRGR